MGIQCPLLSDLISDPDYGRGVLAIQVEVLVFSCFHSLQVTLPLVPFSHLALLFPHFPLLLPSPQDLPSTAEEEHHPNGLSHILDNDVGRGHVLYLPGSHGGAHEH